MAEADGQARRERPIEYGAVKTTIVGGRPPGSGKPVGPIPRGIEVLIKKAAVDPEFRRLLLEKRADAAKEISLALDPAEALMLKAAPAAQLEAIIARTTVAPSLRAAFLGRAAAVMLVALGAGTIGCQPAAESAGESPNRPQAKQPVEPAKPADADKSTTAPKPVEPAKPPAAEPSASEPKAAPPVDSMKPTGIRPDRPESKSAPAPRADRTQPPMPMAGVAPDVPRPPQHAPDPTGIRPDRPGAAPKAESPRPDGDPPTTTGIRADRPQASIPRPALILSDAEPPTPPAPTGIRPDRPTPKPPGPDEPPTFTGISPDRPPVTKGVRPDRPATAPDDTQKGDAQKKVVTALKVPEEWNELKFTEVLATHLRAMAAKQLPGAKVTVQNKDAARLVTVEWKTKVYEVVLPTLNPSAPATRKETGPAADGLTLRAWIEPQLDTVGRPRTLDNAGRWETRLDQVYVLPLGKCLKFDVQWGAKTDRQIVAAFSTPQRWFEGEDVKAQTYVPPAPQTTGPSEAVSRGARPDRPLPKPEPAPQAEQPAPASAPGRMAGVRADRPADE